MCKANRKKRGYIFKNELEFEENLRQERKRRDFLSSQVDKIFEITECQWNEEKPVNVESISQFSNKSTITKSDIYDAIMNEKNFFICKVSFHLPEEHQKPWLALNHPPIFAPINLDEDCVTEDMRVLAKEAKIKFPLQRQLGLRFAVENYIITSSLLRFYLRIGCVLDHIEYVIEYTGQTIFKKFVERITKDRIDATLTNNETKQLISKLVCNSRYIIFFLV